MAYRSNDFRMLYTLTYNVNSKQTKSARRLWPLLIDIREKDEKKINWLKNIAKNGNA